MNYTCIYHVFKLDVKRVIFRAAVDNELGIESFEIFTLKHILLFYLKKTKLIISNDGL